MISNFTFFILIINFTMNGLLITTYLIFIQIPKEICMMLMIIVSRTTMIIYSRFLNEYTTYKKDKLVCSRYESFCIIIIITYIEENRNIFFLLSLSCIYIPTLFFYIYIYIYIYIQDQKIKKLITFMETF